MNDSSYSKSSFSWENSRSPENLNDAILLSSNEEIFYDTTEFSFSSENNSTVTDISNISEVEEYKSCSDLSVSTDSTTMLSLPCPNSNFEKVNSNNVPASSQNSNNLPDQQKMYETDKDVPLKVVLKRMFNEILGKHIKESSTTCLVNEPDNPVEINDNDSLYQLLKDDDDCPASENIKDSNIDNILSPHDTSIQVLNKWYFRNLETILEYSNESTNASLEQNTLNWSGKCMSKLKNLSFQKLSKHWIHDKIFITSDIGDSISSETNNSTDIEMISKEIFRELNDLKENDSLNSAQHNENSLYPNKKMIITNNINNEEYNLFNHKVPSILITPATPI